MGPLRGPGLSGCIKSRWMVALVTRAVARTCKQGKRQDESLKRGAVYPQTRKQMKLICSMKGLDYDLEEMTVISYQCHNLRHHTFALNAEKWHASEKDRNRKNKGNAWVFIPGVSNYTGLHSLCAFFLFFYNMLVSCELLNITFLVNNSFLFFKIGKRHKTTDCTSVTEHDQWLLRFVI